MYTDMGWQEKSGGRIYQYILRSYFLVCLGQKFFDSGDYQMAKQKGRVVGGRMAMPVLAQPPTGEAHPTPDTVPGTYVSGCTSIIIRVHGQFIHAKNWRFSDCITVKSRFAA